MINTIALIEIFRDTKIQIRENAELISETFAIKKSGEICTNLQAFEEAFNGEIFK